MMANRIRNNHISQQFDNELQALRNHLLVMGGMVEKLVTDSTDALVRGDTELAETVRNTEKDVDKLEITIDEECTRVIARRQPTASDLRLVVAASKMVGDLERVGDEADKIAKITIQLSEDGPSPRGYMEVKRISKHVAAMLHDALDAFARVDTELAYKVMQEDKGVNKEYKTATQSLITFMAEDANSLTSVLNVIWTLRALERIGDHAKNIAEQLIYMVKGRDVRHSSLKSSKEIVFED